MTRVLKFRRGTTAEHAVFTGEEGEVTVNIDKDVAVVHDGSTVGGHELVGVDANQRITNKDIIANQLSVSGVSTFDGSVNANQGLSISGQLDVTGIATLGIVTSSQLYVSGVSTFTDLIDSNGGLDVFGQTELDNLNVSGIATIQNLDVQGEFDVYDTTATFHNNLFIAGNLSIGGTSTAITAQDLRVFDKDIILGITTDTFGNDVSTDISANHGGIAIASTEGSPLVDLALVGFSTLPATYKQLMWVAANSYGVGTTDAWHFNYAVGIGSTLVPNGVRLAVSETQFTDDTINTGNINVSENLNVVGVTTLDNVNISGVTTFAGLVDANGGATIDNIRIGVANNNTIDTSTGDLTIDSNAGTVSINDQLSVTGISTFAGLVKTNTIENTVGTSLGTTGTVNLNMLSLTGTYQSINMTGNITFTTSNRSSGRSVSIRLNPGASGRTLTYPGTWRFIGEKLTSLTASKLSVLTLTFFGSNDSDCIAVIASEV